MADVLFLILIAVIILSITTMALTDSARVTLAFLGVLYLCSFVLILQVWPLGLAAVHLLTGLLTVIIVNFYCSKITWQPSTPRNALDILLIVFVGVVAFALAPQVVVYLTEPLQHLVIGFFLFITGLLQAGTSQEEFRVFIGLLILTLGFQVIYAPLEGSALVTALISLVQIALALVGARILIKNREELR